MIIICLLKFFCLALILHYLFLIFFGDDMILKDYLFKSRLPLLQQGLNAYVMRQEVISRNIAGAATQDSQPKRVRFEEYFNDFNQTFNLRQTNISGSGGNTSSGGQIPEPEVYQIDESTVDIDKEMADLAKNQIKFRFASRMVKRFFSGLNYSITGMRE